MNLETSLTEGKVNTESVWVGAIETEADEVETEVGISCWWMCSIFKEKNDTKVLQKSEEYRLGGSESGGFVIFVSREKRALELPSFELIKPEKYMDLAVEMQSL